MAKSSSTATSFKAMALPRRDPGSPENRMAWLPCPYLEADVELTMERRADILRGHPELWTRLDHWLSETLAKPDLVRRDRSSARTHLLSRWYDDLRGGKHVIVIVVTDTQPRKRHWIVTAYLASRLGKGSIEWTPS